MTRYETATVGVDEINLAFLSGDNTRAASLLLDLPETPARNVRLAQVYLRLAEYTKVLQILEHVGNDASSVERVRAHAYRANVYAINRDAARAFQEIEAARQIHLTDADALIDLDYNDAYVSWMLDDHKRASELIGHYVAAANRVPEHARFFTLRAWLFAAQHRYLDQAGALVDAITLYRSAPRPDLFMLAWAVYGLAAVVRDVDYAEGRELVVDLEQSLQWPADALLAQFQTIRAVAWTHALNGEYIASFRKFRAALDIATSPLLKIVASLDEAEVARFSKQDVASQAALADAADMLDRHDWSNAMWEEARVFIHAAELFANVDLGRARSYFERASELRERMASNAGYVHDERLAAHADFADALIRVAGNDRRGARKRASRAYEIFSEYGYQWRAARCALLLHTLDGGEWLAAAQKAIASYPRSFVAQEIDALSVERNPISSLTQRQLDVLKLLQKGLKIEEIATELDISPNTVRIHIGALHRTFKVERRAQLIIEAARWVKAA